MLEPTPQERLALTVLALLIAAGVVARALTGGGEGVWENPAAAADTASGGSVAALRAEVGGRVEQNRRRSTPLAPGERIDPNTAGLDDLVRLPRVGPALAARIVAHRESHGPFRDLADLDAVPGIGPALLSGLAPLVTLEARVAAPSGGGGSARASAAAGSGASQPILRGASRGATSSESLVAVNRASAEELQRLPGVGPAIAARMVEWRDANGRFRGADDLEKVRGIGPALRARVEPRVSFDP